METDNRETDKILTNVQGAANKSNPLPCFVNISTTNRNFCTKIYTTIYHSYLRIAAELY